MRDVAYATYAAMHDGKALEQILAADPPPVPKSTDLGGQDNVTTRWWSMN